MFLVLVLLPRKYRIRIKEKNVTIYQEAEREVFTGLRSQSSSAVSSIVSSRTPGRVLKEPRLFNDNWVNKINSAGRDSRSNEVVLLGLLPPFSENPSWVKKPETSATISAIADSRIPGRVSKELKLFYDNWVPKNSSGPDSRNK